jgi:acetyl esterase
MEKTLENQYGSKLPNRSQLLPEIKDLLEEMDELPVVAADSISLKQHRENSIKNLTDLWGPRENVDNIEDLILDTDHGLKARIYRPDNSTGTILFFHGGGWVVGDLETHDGSCRMLANLSGAAVVSVEYRKAPEHRFPAALNDCDMALRWLIERGKKHRLDTEGILICGESAGGNLAAITAIHARDKGIKLVGQILIYPVISTEMSTKSYRDFESGFFLTAERMRWFIGHYADAADLKNPDITPLNCSNLAGLAPALVLAADHDPLRDEGRAYAAAMVLSGCDVVYREIPGTVHGVWIMNARTAATCAMITDAAKWARARLNC